MATNSVTEVSASSRPLAIRANKVHEIAPWGRSYTYELIASGRLRAKKLGRATYILLADLEAFLEAMPDAVTGVDMSAASAAGKIEDDNLPATATTWMVTIRGCCAGIASGLQARRE